VNVVLSLLRNPAAMERWAKGIEKIGGRLQAAPSIQGFALTQGERFSSKVTNRSSFRPFDTGLRPYSGRTVFFKSYKPRSPFRSFDTGLRLYAGRTVFFKSYKPVRPSGPSIQGFALTQGERLSSKVTNRSSFRPFDTGLRPYSGRTVFFKSYKPRSS
jgi:hypothetical protein